MGNTSPTQKVSLNEKIQELAVQGPKAPREDGVLERVPLDAVGPHPNQPRTVIDEPKLRELMNGIVQTGGLLQPINIRPEVPGEAKVGEPVYQYRLIAGQRRLEAYKRLRDAAASDGERSQWATIPAIVALGRNAGDALRDAIVENTQRDNLTPLDEAEALATLKDERRLKTVREVAAAVGMKEDRVKRLLRLTSAPPIVKEALRRGLTTVREATPGADGADLPTPKRETLRRLELSEALSFADLYDHYFAKYGGTSKAKAAQKAEGVVRTAIERAIAEGWGVRRIEAHVEAMISGRAPRGDEPATETSGPALYAQDSKRFTVHLARLQEASAEQRQQLASELRALLELVVREAA